MKQARNLLLLTVLLITLLTGVFFFLQTRQKSPYVVNMSSETVIKQIRSLNRLETASFTIEKVIDAGTSGGKFQNLLFGDRLLLIAHGQVIAGFDLSQLSPSAVKEDGKTLTVTLPAPQILITTLDNTQTRVYDRQQGLLTKGDKDLESQARSEAEKAIRDAACQGNILGEATKNARNQLTAMLKSLGYQTVVVDIPTGRC